MGNAYILYSVGALKGLLHFDIQLLIDGYRAAIEYLEKEICLPDGCSIYDVRRKPDSDLIAVGLEGDMFPKVREDRTLPHVLICYEITSDDKKILKTIEDADIPKTYYGSATCRTCAYWHQFPDIPSVGACLLRVKMHAMGDPMLHGLQGKSSDEISEFLDIFSKESDETCEAWRSELPEDIAKYFDKEKK